MPMKDSSIPKTNIEATRANDPSLLDRDVLEFSDTRNQTVLFYAIRQKANYVLEAIINKTPVNQQNAFLDTPLHIAASIGNVHAIDTLLEHNANPSIMNKKGTTPLMAAARKGSLECVSSLLVDSVDIADQDTFGNTVLFYAVEGNNTEVFNFLVENGASPHRLNNRFETLHHMASKHANLAMVKCLERHRVPLYPLSEYKESPLHHAAKKGKTDIVRVYLERGLSPNKKDGFMKTPFEYGHDFGDIEMLFTRFTHALDKEKALDEHPLCKALRQGDYETADVLIKEGKNLNDKDCFQNRPVLYILIYGYEPLYKALREKDIQMTDIDYYGHDTAYYMTFLNIDW